MFGTWEKLNALLDVYYGSRGTPLKKSGCLLTFFTGVVWLLGQFYFLTLPPSGWRTSVIVVTYSCFALACLGLWAMARKE